MVKMRWVANILVIASIHVTVSATPATREASSEQSSESSESSESTGPSWVQSRHEEEMTKRARWRVEGQAVMLECRASGRPKPTITWRRNDRDVPPITTNQRFVADKWSLGISQLQVNDTAIYTCRAENEAGVIEKHFALIVFGRGNVSVPEVRAVSPTQQTVFIGQRTNFTCSVETLSPSLVQWVRYESESPQGGVLSQSHRSNGAVLEEVYINGSMILSVDGWRTSHREVTSSRDRDVIRLKLVLTNVTDEDSGDYACVASNSGGITQKRVRLKVIPHDRLHPASTTESASQDFMYAQDYPGGYLRSIVVAVSVVFICVIVGLAIMIACGIRKALRSEETVYQEVLDLTT